MADRTVLITDANAAKSVSVLRSLKRHGLRVVAAVAEDKTPIATHSRFCDEIVVHPSLHHEKTLQEFLLRYLNDSKIDVLLPLDDDTLEFLVRCRQEMESLTNLAMPPSAAINIASDKGKTISLADQVENGLATPRTYEIDRLEDLPGLQVQRFPVLVKPRSAWGAIGIMYAANHQELSDAYLRVHERFPNPIIQEYVDYREGEKYQLLYLFDALGQLRSWFMHRVVVEESMIQRVQGSHVRGGSALHWSSCKDENLLARGQRLLEALDWRGFGFIECVRDRRDGQVKLLEINARLSGTIALPLRCGVDFAHDACLVALGKTPPRVVDYAVGARTQHWLFTLAELGRQSTCPQLRSCLNPRVPDSVFAWSDPAPFFFLARRSFTNWIGRQRISGGQRGTVGAPRSGSHRGLRG